MVTVAGHEAEDQITEPLHTGYSEAVVLGEQAASASSQPRRPVRRAVLGTSSAEAPARTHVEEHALWRDFVVEHRGSGRPLLLLHSGFGTWVEFRRLIDHLAADHEVLAPNLPGSLGGPPLDVRHSMLGQHVEYAESLLDEVGWTDPVLIVGSSYGGVTALQLEARGRAARAVGLPATPRGPLSVRC